MNRNPRGFTLVELMVTVAVLAVLIALAAPSFTDTMQRRRLIGAAEAVASGLQLARSEAIRQSASMTAVTTTGASWCMGFARGTTACDCSITDTTDTDACTTLGDGSTSVLRVVSAGQYSGVSMSLVTGTPATVTFDGVRGTAAGADDTKGIRFTLGGRELQVRVNPLGGVRMCSPAGTTLVAGYSTC